MKRCIAVLLFALAASPLPAKVSWAGVAAGTTISVNLLEIRSTTAKAVKAARATKTATVKAAKKIAGK